jgi:hypothetical protein
VKTISPGHQMHRVTPKHLDISCRYVVVKGYWQTKPPSSAWGFCVLEHMFHLFSTVSYPGV